MQSPKMYLPSSPPLKSTQQNISNFSTSKSVQTETESVRKLTKEDFKYGSKEKLKDSYCRALEFVNHCHKTMNDMLEENFKECGDLKPNNYSSFKLPEVPNYISIFYLLLDKYKTDQGNKYKHGNELLHLFSKDAKLDGFNVLNLTQDHFQKRETDILNVFFFEDLEIPNKKSENGDMVNRRCSSDIDVEYKYSLREVSSEMEIRRLDKNTSRSRLGENKQNNKLTEIIRNQVKTQVANHLKRLKRKRIRSQEAKKNIDSPLVQDNFPIIDIPPQINLFEYTRKKSENKEYVVENVLQTHFTRNHKGTDEVYFDYHKTSFDIPLRVKRSTTNVVNEMFKKISQENIVSNYTGNGQNISSGRSKKPLSPRCPMKMELNQKDSSDSDSIILDDDEFEKTNQIYCSNPASNKANPRRFGNIIISPKNIAVGIEKKQGK